MFLLYFFLFITIITSQNPIVNTGIECNDNTDCINFCDLGIIYNTKCSFETYINGYNITYNETSGNYVQYCSYNKNKPIQICDKGCSFNNNSYECNLNCPSLNPCLFDPPYICNNNTLYQNIFNIISNECNYIPLYNCSDYNLKCSTNSLNISMCYSVIINSTTAGTSLAAGSSLATGSSLAAGSSLATTAGTSLAASTSLAAGISLAGSSTTGCNCNTNSETSSANTLNLIW